MADTMVNPGDGERLAQRVSSLYGAAELRLLRTITRMLSRGTGQPGWALAKLQDLSLVQSLLRESLRGLDEQVSARVPQVIEAAAGRGSAGAISELREVDLPRVPAPARVLSVSLIAQDTLRRVYSVPDQMVRAGYDLYQDVVAEASTQVLSGSTNRRDAAQHALDRLAGEGIRGFRDSAGRNWTAESYVEMSVRTTTGQAAVQAHTETLKANHINLVQISDSPRECKVCRPWEGKILSLDGQTGDIEVQSVTSNETMRIQVAGTLDEARSDGLMHPNCRHNASAYLPGATVLPTNTEDTEERVSQEQRQRAIERNIRKWKRREALAMDPQTEQAAKAKVRRWQGEMRQHLADTSGLTRKSSREQIGRAR